MYNKKFVKFFLTLFLIIGATILVYSKFFKINKTELTKKDDETIYNSNIIKDVEYSTKDKDGNEYFIKAEEGEIDFTNSNIIFLKKVKALIKLIDSAEVTITSNFGKYNSEDYDTIFSKNVIINYLDNKITGEYLDFSLKRNSMIVSKNVIYNNLKNVLRAVVVEINLKNKDTKIFMYEQNKKVNIKSIN